MSELGLIFGIALVGLCFAAYLARWVLARPVGDEDLSRVAAEVRKVAEGFSRRLSGTVGALSAVLGGVVFLAYGLVRREGDADPVPTLELGVWLTASLAVGAASALLAGRVSTWISTRASVRAAAGARRSVDLALQIALRGGAVSGLTVAASSLVGQGALFAAVFASKGGLGGEPGAALRLVPAIPMLVGGYALGAAFAALLVQLGGGVFAKAADVGADLAAREAGLDDDDPKNPAAITDLAGDAAGDGASRAAGLFAGTVAENLGAMMIGAAVWRENAGLPSALAVVLFPLVARSFGVVGAVFGVMVVRTDDREDPMSALARGLHVAVLLQAVGMAGAAKWLLGTHWLRFFGCGLLGIGTSVALLYVVQYYTEARFRPARELAESARGGPPFVVLGGLSTGLESTLAPLGLVLVVAFVSFRLGWGTGLAGGGLLGTAVATAGMLGSIAYVLAMDGLGPIVDAAGGLVEMTVGRERPDVRGRTVLLDGIGNTTKAFAKAHGAVSAGLGSLLLVAAYLGEAHRRAVALGHEAATPTGSWSLRLDAPLVLLGAALGLLLVFWLAGHTISSVTRAARRVLEEARRRSREESDRSGVGEAASRAALRELLLPAAIVPIVPVAVGLGLRWMRSDDYPLLAADSVAALLVAATIAGILGSLLLGNAGAAWDNAKKYIVTGAHGGRRLVDEAGLRTVNPTFVAASIGDAVGDPLKDAAGPAIHLLVKLLSVITIVFLPFFV